MKGKKSRFERKTTTVDAGAVDYVVTHGYAPDLTDDEIENSGATRS
jgi:hypothetical protein